MFHVCVQRFDVTKNLKFFFELNKAKDELHVQGARIMIAPATDKRGRTRAGLALYID